MDKVVSLADFATVVRQLADGTDPDFIVMGELFVDPSKAVAGKETRTLKCLQDRRKNSRVPV